MEAKACLTNVRISPRKVSVVLDLIRGKDAANAMAISKTAPKSALGKALYYLLEQWPYLVRYLEDGRLELSNNRAERSIKPFVMGRKNWLFANTPGGAQASSVIYSLIETAKENHLDPYLCRVSFVFGRWLYYCAACSSALRQMPRYVSATWAVHSRPVPAVFCKLQFTLKSF